MVQRHHVHSFASRVFVFGRRDGLVQSVCFELGLSNSMEVEFCLEALDDAFTHGTPDVFNTDQGSQFTSRLFTERFESKSIEISIDGRGRALEPIVITG